MISYFIELITEWILAIITRFGYTGIFVTMALESAAISIPSEVVLPFSGFLSSRGELNFWLVVIVASLANLVGSIFIYWVGYYGGRPLLERYGKYVFLHRQEIDKMDRWLAKYQSWAAFFTRLIPALRTFSSLIIGAAKGINFAKFAVFTFLGSFIWNLLLAYAGFVAGENWDFLHPYFEKAHNVIAAAIILIVAAFVYRHFKKGRKAHE